ncbi:small ribosomal subunit protein mS23-like [Mytilus trossulus]|uniref:small ribosomal subunit protein mS23-like n=1 Tax=Mytilus trossulus TaxID=6551 RepID=UPI003005A0BA
MAGSRIDKFSNIFARVEGMIRSGAMKYEDKPIWFNVYKAFPPKVNPTFTRKAPENQQVVNILYPEDLVRAKYYAVYGSQKSQEVVDLTDKETPTQCQRFVDKYFELKRSGRVSDEDLFRQAASYMRTQGFKLESEVEKKEQKELHNMAQEMFPS